MLDFFKPKGDSKPAAGSRGASPIPASAVKRKSPLESFAARTSRLESDTPAILLSDSDGEQEVQKRQKSETIPLDDPPDRRPQPKAEVAEVKQQPGDSFRNDGNKCEVKSELVSNGNGSAVAPKAGGVKTEQRTLAGVLREEKPPLAEGAGKLNVQPQPKQANGNTVSPFRAQ